MIKNKKASHVGMIISFLIFITFLSFLYSVTEPLTKVKQDKLDLLEYLKTELEKEFINTLSTVTVSINEGISGSCYKFGNIPDITDTGAVIQTLDGDVLKSYFDNAIDKVKMEAYNGVVKMYFSDSFNQGEDFASECTALSEGVHYNITRFVSKEELFEAKIINISESINANIEYYENLKDKLGLSLEDNFGFRFTNETKEFVTGTEEKDVSTDVYVEEVPIQYIDSKANIKPGFLTIKVW